MRDFSREDEWHNITHFIESEVEKTYDCNKNIWCTLEPYTGCPYPYPCPCPWVLGGHGFDIIVHGWAWVSLVLPVNRDTIARFSILLWWKLKWAPTFPIMSCVVRSVLCIPASSSKSESNFSDAGNTLTNQRSELKPTTMNDLLFVQSNQDLV